MDLLVFLAQHPGEVVSKDLLLDGVWGTNALSESALTRSMTELRQALADDAEHPRIIETIPKRGYRVIAPIHSVSPPTPVQNSAPGVNEEELREPAFSERRSRVVWGVAGLVLGLIAAGLVAFALTGAENRDPSLVRFLLPPPEGATFAAVPSEPQPAVSPDGRRIATVAMDRDASVRIWVHTLDSLAPQPLTGTEGAYEPFWSPDGEWIGFFADGKLKKIRARGGPVDTLCDAPAGWGGTWNAGGTVLFAPTRTSGLFSVSASGGRPIAATSLDRSRGETSHWFPQFLPDGTHYIYLVRSNRSEHRGIYLGSTDSAERKRLIDADTNAVFVKPGYLFFVRNAALMAQAFDPARGAMTGDAVPVAEGVIAAPTVRRAPFSVGANTLTYRVGGMRKTRLVWIDRRGNPLATVGAPAAYLTPTLSPDGTRLAVDVLDARRDSIDTWIFDLARNVSSRFTSGPGPNGYPIWPPDGARIVFASNRTGTWNLYEKSTYDLTLQDGRAERALLESQSDKYPQDWSRHGIVYAERNEETGFDLWLLPSTAPGKPAPLLQTRFNETQAQLSPDGRWLAYTSDESGKLEVYVRSVAPSQSKWRVSRDGGCQPRWRADGKELYFLQAQHLFAVRMDRGTTLNPGIPVVLFELRAGRTNELSWEYVPALDGQKFLFKELVVDEMASPMVTVLNWQALPAR